jgi:serine/threonine-protein kinase RsbT
LENNGISEETIIDLAQLSDHAQVVYAVRHLTAQMGFDESQQYLIATAASEASTNVIRYAEKGRVTLRAVVDGDRVGFEFVVEDRGPGIKDMEAAMEEGVSNGHGLGLGLSSIKRIMDEFDIQSKPGTGTRVVARKWRRNAED